MSATMFRPIADDSPLAKDFTEAERLAMWAPGCYGCQVALELVEYNAEGLDYPFASSKTVPRLYCSVCGEIYAMGRRAPILNISAWDNSGDRTSLPENESPDHRLLNDLPLTLGMAKSMLREKTGAIDILLDEKDALYVKLAEWEALEDEVRRLEQVVRDRDQQAEDVAAGRLILDEVVDVVAEANAWLKVSAAIPNTPSREEYQYDRGYWAAMVDIMRHLHYWEGVGLKTITDAARRVLNWGC